MTAELEDQQEKPKEEKLDAKSPDEKSPDSDDKIQEIEEENPKNGGGKNDIKKEIDEVEVEAQETDGGQDDEEVVVAPRRRMPRFLEGLFKRSKKHKEDKNDAEAGTELLAKDSKIEVKAEEKVEKNDTGTDVTVPITDDVTVDAPNGQAKEEPQVKGGRPYWRKVGIGLLVVILLLIVVSVISVLTISNENSRGPMVDPIVVTDCGLLKGKIEDNVYVFKGIPYALPPTGEHRWKPPRSPSVLKDCWNGTYEALNSTPYCYQKSIPNLDLEFSEDCLYLDIITPSLSPPKPRPVVVYIPGDAPLQGYSSSDIQWRPTTMLADEKDVTFVTVNYRSGVFGFLVLDILTNNVRPPTSGNYGIMDMIAALKWVQRNIRGFGGDPQRVTVLANGGGATAALAVLASKKSEGLFNRMWLTSPSAHFSNESVKQIGEDNLLFLRNLNNCNNVECLYNKSAEDILQATPSVWGTNWALDLPSNEEEPSPVMTVIDGAVLYDTPPNMWKSGVIQQVPVVIGAMAQESGSSKLLPDLNKWSWTDFTDYVSEKLGTISTDLAVAAIELYIQNSSTPIQQFHSMVSDIRTICPLNHLTKALEDALEEDVYWYVVNYKPSSPFQLTNDSDTVPLSVHGMDIASIFGLLHRYIFPMEQSDLVFQKNIQDLFYNFVYRGTPEIHHEALMPSEFVNIIGNQIQSRLTPYENCNLWNNESVYPAYSKVN